MQWKNFITANISKGVVRFHFRPRHSEQLLVLLNNSARIPQLVKPMKKLKLKITFVLLLGMLASTCSSGGGGGRDLNTSKADDDLSNSHSSWPSLSSEVTRDVESTVASILSSMTTAEKVGQMVQAEISNVTPNEARDWNLGSVLNGGGSWPKGQYSTVADWVALADSFYEASTDTSDGGVGIPIIWGTDAVHGHNNVVGATISLITLALAQQTTHN